jgi:hypothetical protein
MYFTRTFCCSDAIPACSLSSDFHCAPCVDDTSHSESLSKARKGNDMTDTPKPSDKLSLLQARAEARRVLLEAEERWRLSVASEASLINMFRAVVDREEGDFLILELTSSKGGAQHFIEVPKKDLPNVKEGDILTVEFSNFGTSIGQAK